MASRPAPPGAVRRGAKRRGLGDIYMLLGRQAQAADDHGRALRIARANGHRPGELNAFTGLG